MCREFVSKNSLQPIEEYSDPTHSPRPRTQLQTISTCNAEGSAAYCNGRIDDILLPKHIADIVHVPRTCETMGYRSDHVPLVAYLATKSLNFNIPVPKPPTPQPKPPKTLCRTISEKGKQAFTYAAQDPAYGITRKLQHTRKMVDSAHDEAIGFLNGLKNVSAKTVTRLHLSVGKRPKETSEDTALQQNTCPRTTCTLH